MAEYDDRAPESAPGPARNDGKPADLENSQPVNSANSQGAVEQPSQPDTSESAAATDLADSVDDRSLEYDSDRSSGNRSVYLNQYFTGTVNASGSRFGVSDIPKTPVPLTGKLNASDIEELAVGYVRPAAFAAAFEALQRVHAVVLEGASGTGRRAGATMLLHELATGPLKSLPPMPVEELAKYEYEVGLGYLVADSEFAGPRVNSEHGWHTVRDQVCDAGAWLVITGPATNGRGSEFVPSVKWQQPETHAAVRTWLGLTDIADSEFDAKLAEIESHVPSEFALSELRQVVTLVGNGVETADAIQVFKEGARQRVGEWFDAHDERSRRTMLTVTAAAFLGRCGQRLFESYLIELEHHFVGTESAADGVNETLVIRGDLIPELRSIMVDDKSLLRLKSAESSITPKSDVAFREDSYREYVIAELWRRMDVNFWNIVRDWLCDILAESSDNEVTHEHGVAQALLELANIAFDEVAEAYLEPWSRGERGLACRDMAIFVLWDMCAGKVLAPVALQIAARWAESGTAHQKWTAAYALSGVIGFSYPEEAAGKLWRLIIRSSNRDAEERCDELAELFARLATRSPQADAVLTFLVAKHGDARLGRRGRLLVEFAITRVLAIRDSVTGRSAIFSHLDDFPSQEDIVAQLWTIALRRNDFRRRVLDALLDGLHDLIEISAEPERTTRTLASAFARTLPPRQCRALAHNLTARHRQRTVVASKRRAIRRSKASEKAAQRESRVTDLVRILLAPLVINHTD
ncbi:hypothetical protein ACIA8C_13240 [Nocardia sp. NPDC051321]|uniref:hypothetical protein n=1 Tax=Nocardia sp. NPDC051321 TaxID=3364323 RepID=UPI0037BA578D